MPFHLSFYCVILWDQKDILQFFSHPFTTLKDLLSYQLSLSFLFLNILITTGPSTDLTMGISQERPTTNLFSVF